MFIRLCNCTYEISLNTIPQMKLHNVSLELVIDSGTHIRISWEKQDKTRSRKNTRGKTKQNREKKIRKWKLARKGNRGVYLCTCVLFPWKHVFFSPDCTEFVAAHWQFPRADSLSLSLHLPTHPPLPAKSYCHGESTHCECFCAGFTNTVFFLFSSD